MTQSVDKQVGEMAAIEAEFHLFRVGRKVFGANPVSRAHDSALERRESRFNRTGVNVSHDVDAQTMLDFLVGGPLGLPHCRLIGGGHRP